MESRDRFSITIGEPIVREGDEAAEPQDPLGELTHLEMGLWLYCYWNNRRIVIAIGGRSFVVELNPDVSIVLDEFRSAIAHLSSGLDAKLSFYELGTSIYFAPEAEDARCVLERSGYVFERGEFRLILAQVVDQLKGFLNGIVRSAADGGYITVTEAQLFLSEK